MKKYFAIAALLLTVYSFGQKLPNNLHTAVYKTSFKDTVTRPQLSPALAYYSKNYEAVFGEYQYTFNSTAFTNTKNIFIAPDDKFYYNAGTKFITNMPFAGDTVWPDAYGRGAFTAGVVSMALGQNLTNLENAVSAEINKLLK